MSRLHTLTIDDRIESFLEVYRWQCTVSRERILSRRNLSLESVHPFAGSMTIVDVSDPAQWSVRLAGTGVCERLGRDITGFDAMAGLGDEERALRRTLAERLFAGPCGIRATFHETYRTGDHNLIDTLSLPLTTAEGARLIVTYAQVVEDANFEFCAQPRVVDSRIEAWRAVDLPQPVEGRGTMRAIA